MLSITDLRRLYLGVQGENETRPIVIDVRPWLVQYPNGSVTIWHRRHGYSVPEPTGAVFDAQEGTVTWEPTDTDTYVAGEGEAEIRLTTPGGAIKKTRKVITGVSDAVTLAGSVLGSDWQSYINAVDGLRAGAVEAKTAAETAQGLAEDAQDDAEDAAELAEMWATGETGGTPASNNNAAYWSGKAESYKNDAKGYAEAAEGSAGDAAGSASDAEGSAGDAAAWATGSATPASPHSATNNAYYYSESAAASAQQANLSKNSAATAAGNAQADALKAEGYAIGTQNGQQAGAPYFHDNAKYYAEQTAQFATAAGTAQAQAEQWATGGSSGTPSATNNAKYYAEQAEAQVALVEAEGTTQIGLVEAEGTTQIGLVEDKGEEVLESIPSDYSTLSSDVSNLKSAIEDIEDEIQSISSVPTNVRASILTLFKNAVFKDTGLTDEIAIVESWAEAVTAITLNHTTISISGTGTSQLVATTTPPGGAITWSSSDTSVATVNSSGLVTGCSNGTATITATCGDISARCTATVTGFATLESIEATYTQSGTVYENETLSNLVPDLVVVANYSDSTTATLTSDQYTLSGSLVIGTSTITVSFGGKTDTFTVTVSAIPTVVSISAVYTQGIVYENDNVDDLKSNLVVTALYDDTSTETVDANDYSLSGSLAVGTSTITVTYQSKTTTFTVTVYGFEAQRKKTIAGGAGATAKVSANNSRCLNIGTSGTNEVKNSDGTPSGLYPVPIRSGITKIYADLGDEIITTLQILQWDSANNVYTKAFGGEWHLTAKEYSLTQYNDGTYFCAIIAAKKTSATTPTADSTFDFTDYVFSKYEIYFE